MGLDELKLFLRIDGTEEDSLLLSLQSAAENFMTNAGVTVDYNNELYKLAIKLLVSHWHENREVVGNANKLAFSLDTIITQLKYCQTVTP